MLGVCIKDSRFHFFSVLGGFGDLTVMCVLSFRRYSANWVFPVELRRVAKLFTSDFHHGVAAPNEFLIMRSAFRLIFRGNKRLDVKCKFVDL